MITFTCDFCGKTAQSKPSDYSRKKRHFCSVKCYSQYREILLPPEEQNAWAGGKTNAESVRDWKKRNKTKLKAIDRARRIREMNAPGHHTAKDWQRVKEKFGNRCAEEDETCKGSITKDHIVPLVMGGSQDPINLQPLCRSHNARKGRRVAVGITNE